MSAVEVRLAVTPAELAAAHRVRDVVFGVEQSVPPEIEKDALDADADHVVAVADGVVVATGRLVTGPDGVGVIGRMAVLAAARGTGLGRAVLAGLEAQAAGRRLPAVTLHAQTHARGFYERAGYTAVGAQYQEADIPHVTMRKPLPVLRPVADEDSAALIALIEGCWSDYPGCVMDVDGEEPWLRAPGSAYAAKRGRFWVVELDGALVACVGLVADELKTLYVSRGARRRGLGTRLVALVEDAARAEGAAGLVLWSDTRFTDAHRLYERLGYARAPGARERHDRSGTVEYRYAKPLPAGSARPGR